MIRSVLIAMAATSLLIGDAVAQEPRLRTGGASGRIMAADGYDAAIFARRLGHVSAMTRHDDGTLYTADREGGRIFRILDRRLDGNSDLTQALPHRFDRPSGLAIAGDILFVADQGGVWRVRPGGGTPDLLAPFANAGAGAFDHPIMMMTPNIILLGLNRADGTARLLSINAQTGAATLREEGPGRIIGFASAAEAEADQPQHPPTPWIILKQGGSILFGSSLASSREIDAPIEAVWIDEAKAQARIALPDGVFETVATFAGLADKGTPILRGFNGDVRPGVMVSDARGLFVADQSGGRLWLVSTASAVPVAETPPLELKGTTDTPPARDLSSRPELMRGSRIGSASTLGAASTMPNASTLPDADQPRSASDPKE